MNAQNKRHGKGILRFPRGEGVYVGIFEEGAMTKGRITYPKAEVETWFKGTFLNGQWDKGVYRKGPVLYEGTFINQEIDGFFKIIWETTGIIYEG